MDAFTSSQTDSSELRSHPWTAMQNDQTSVYMDFKKNPKLIRQSLEDFIPLKKWDFVESFYALVEWINSPQSVLESNDCTFNVAQQNTDNQYPYAQKCSARLMILFRDIPENCQQRSIDWLMQNILQSVASTKQGFKAGAICLSQNETCYLALGDSPDTGGMGLQIVLTFFAYGKNDKRCYENMEQVISHAHDCLKKVNKKIVNGELDAIYG
ncbi:hypothetical protein [Psychromonas sp. Urea-02u-13]|uniref:hypothetical protein n=1 Tax=Psychromonas sp. Urea-02u-13 TaxID=2058326 RepID=UPI000C33C65D|nr:hypothetical protein [Psychromonas sp. Urea-02u-13]PKG37780.1 hypothetical protein CXF74_17185 [Psychromonas sp. Urea-02u-13]